MSVEFYECDCCEESRYEEYVGHCSKCGHSLCSWCLIDKDGIDSRYANDYGVKCDGTKEQADEYGFDIGDYKVGDVIDDSGIDSKHCPFCSGNKVHDEDLLEYLLSRYGLSKDKVIQEYKDNK